MTIVEGSSRLTADLIKQPVWIRPGKRTPEEQLQENETDRLSDE